MSTSPSAKVMSVRRGSRVPLAEVGELGADHAVDALLVAEDRPQLADRLQQLRVLGPDLVGLERGQALQAHVEDRLRLDVGELELGDQPGAGVVGVRRTADQGDHRVEVVERDQDPLEDVRPGLGLAQLVLRAADHHLALMADVVVDHLLQGEGPRHVVDEGNHVDPEARLHLRVLVELAQRDLRDRVALQLDDQAHARAIGLVAEVGDLGQLLVADQIGDLGDQPAVAALADRERQLGDDDRLLAALDRLDVGLGPDPHRPAARPVGVADARRAHDRAAAREVGPLDVLHQALGVDLRVLDVGLDRADHLAEVVRRDVGGHADGDPRRTVDEQVREPRRQHQRLGQGVVVVRPEVDRLRLDVAEHLGREPGEPRLRVVADESVRDERVVVGVDLDREDGLAAGGLDRGDLGVEVVAGDQRPDHVLDLAGNRSAWRSRRRRAPSDRPDRCCAG